MIRIECFGTGSSGNCFSISYNGVTLLLDAGIKPVQMIRQGFSTSGACGVCVTHEHMDHAKYLKEWQRLGVPVYTSDSVMQSQWLEDGYQLECLNVGDIVRIGPYEVMAFDLAHDVPNMGFMVKAGRNVLAYITDTYYCRYKLQGVTHLLLEINYSEPRVEQAYMNGVIPKRLYTRLRRSHFSLEKALQFIESMDKSQLQEVHIIHMSNDNGDEEYFKKQVQRATGVFVKVW